MRQIILVIIITLIIKISALGQFPNDSIYASWWENKHSSIFNNADKITLLPGSTIIFTKKNKSGCCYAI